MTAIITLAAALTTNTDAENLALLQADLAAAGVDAAGASPFSASVQLPAQVARGRTVAQEIRATVVRAGLGDFAADVPDEWVDNWAFAWWGVTRVPATKARFLWPVTSASGTIAIPARRAVADGITSLFENVGAINVTAGKPQLVEFEARTPGTDGNVAPGAVTGFQIGAAGLGITSPAGSMIAGGAPRETSTGLVRRGRARLPSRSTAGNAVGFDAWVREVAPSVNRWAVDDTNPNGPGSTDLIAANGAGPATADELAALAAFFGPRRGKGTGPLRVLAAPEQTVAFGLLMRVRGNAGAAAQASQALQALEATIDLGGSSSSVLQLDTIREPLLAIPGVYQLLFSGIAETTPITTFAVLSFIATISVAP